MQLLEAGARLGAELAILFPLKDLAEPAPARSEEGPRELEGAARELDRTGVIGEGNARRLGGRVGQHQVVGGREGEECLRPELEDVGAENADEGGELGANLFEVDPDRQALRADPLGGVLEPGAGGAPEIDQTIARSDQRVSLVDLAELIEGAGGVPFPLGAAKKKSFGSKRLTISPPAGSFRRRAVPSPRAASPALRAA